VGEGGKEVPNAGVEAAEPPMGCETAGLCPNTPNPEPPKTEVELPARNPEAGGTAPNPGALVGVPKPGALLGVPNSGVILGDPKPGVGVLAPKLEVGGEPKAGVPKADEVAGVEAGVAKLRPVPNGEAAGWLVGVEGAEPGFPRPKEPKPGANILVSLGIPK
jgi:hypothetical protein